jgi:hypothetical protein
MARDSNPSGRPAVMVVVALLIALPGLLVTSRATPIPPNAPPALDRFLAAVDHLTPPTAHILVAGAPPALVFYRATYLLYPRIVYTAFATDYAHGWTAPAVNWRALLRRAHRAGARHVLLWALPVAPHATVVVRAGLGWLVQVTLGPGLPAAHGCRGAEEHDHAGHGPTHISSTWSRYAR